MEISTSLINGLAVGVEYVQGFEENDDDFEHMLLISFFLISFIFEWSPFDPEEIDE